MPASSGLPGRHSQSWQPAIHGISPPQLLTNPTMMFSAPQIVASNKIRSPGVSLPVADERTDWFPVPVDPGIAPRTASTAGETTAPPSAASAGTRRLTAGDDGTVLLSGTPTIVGLPLTDTQTWRWGDHAASSVSTSLMSNLGPLQEGQGRRGRLSLRRMARSRRALTRCATLPRIMLVLL